MDDCRSSCTVREQIRISGILFLNLVHGAVSFILVLSGIGSDRVRKVLVVLRRRVNASDWSRFNDVSQSVWRVNQLSLRILLSFSVSSALS